MKIKKELITRNIAGDTILVPVGKSVYEADGLFVLNELAAFIWARLPQAENREALLDAVLEEYEVTREEAAADLDEFLNRLTEMGII